MTVDSRNIAAELWDTAGIALLKEIKAVITF